METIDLKEVFRASELQTPFRAGEVIFREGDPGDFMYVLMDGEVEVQIAQRVVGAFAAVEVFGEMALLDTQPRSATVVARTDCKLITITQQRFKTLIQKNPDFGIYIMQILVERIRWMNTAAKAKAEQQQPA